MVTGHGMARSRPDTARLEGRFQGICGTYDEAVSESTSRVFEVRGMLESAGFDADILRTLQVSVRPYYEHEVSDGRHRDILSGYEYSHCVRIDVDPFDGSVDRLLSSMATEASTFSLTYMVTDATKVKADARRDAVRDACENASQLSSAAGVGLGRIMTIRYGESHHDARVLMCSGNARASMDMTPEDVEFTDSVTIEWEII